MIKLVISNSMQLIIKNQELTVIWNYFTKTIFLQISIRIIWAFSLIVTSMVFWFENTACLMKRFQ